MFTLVLVEKVRRLVGTEFVKLSDEFDIPQKTDFRLEKLVKE